MTEEEQKAKVKDERNRTLALRSAVLRAKRLIAELSDAIDRAEENLPPHTPDEAITGPLTEKFMRRGLYENRGSDGN